MKKNFKTILLIGAIVVAIVVSCDKDTESRAKKASKEACECMKKNTQKYCEDELNKKYFITQTFIDEFNKVNDCGIKLYKKN